jgi:hypothetical protein
MAATRVMHVSAWFFNLCEQHIMAWRCLTRGRLQLHERQSPGVGKATHFALYETLPGL